MKFRTYALVVSACSSLGCSSAEEGNGPHVELSETGSSIIRATSNGGRNEAVMIYVKFDNDGYVGTRTCSGSYFAPRVVLTAAHCLEGAYTNQVHVYYGDNFAQDYAQVADENGFVVAPPPGQPSTFSRVDSFETHPAWDPALVHPDMAVVYLDRKLPFDPLPLARFNIDSSYNNKEATFSGWGANTVTGPVSATGAQVQRTGKTKILRKPTAADYHADDPNPGMLNATVRNNVIKTYGKAPYSNGCFGDSGGPLFVSKYGQTYIAGVSYWTGLFCEDYNLYTRIDPFLPFLDQAYKKGGQEVLKPTFDCVSRNDDGSYAAYFGYDNKNGVGVTVPYGNKNKLALDTKSRRPTLFAPGAYTFQFGVKFTANQTLSYTLSPENSPTTTLTVNKNSKSCGEERANEVECAAACEAQFSSGCPVNQSFGTCVESCLATTSFFVEVFPDCVDEYSDYNACVAATPSGEDNWICDPDFIAATLSCDEAAAAIGACMGY